ncbi:hypothetical protein PFICI_12546 [Pestalotiopsis fici W106-1]|uniref:N-acetyltransferase domain-containing protein n=1 Tax=Pestalotiopsis fici (strain W106-1 / CGMCC3.15140) TaxID=1229662 RepID=W3WR14_PESFW|nr:uncharacterized protein PFICI_12546 [Pestalotiopsis fici W106-1]ETS75602.1 hypothetical protein PFICI_12546 [Pestalotiopsis fici W106-1]
MIHGFLLRPSIWQPLLPEPKVGNALRAFAALDGHFMHAINSGCSYAIVDSEYEFRKAESAVTGGCLYWDQLDPEDPDFETKGTMLMLEGMDFPVVVRLALDVLDKKPDTATQDLYDFIPLVRELGTWLSVRGGSKSSSPGDAPSSSRHDQPASWGEALIRSGCVTKEGYEGRGLMTALNRFMMLEARARGYRTISVGVADWSVYRCWMSPPPGCRSRITAEFRVWDIELEDEDGRLVRPYVNSGINEQGWLIRCDLSQLD